MNDIVFPIIKFYFFYIYFLNIGEQDVYTMLRNMKSLAETTLYERYLDNNLNIFHKRSFYKNGINPLIIK